MSKIIVTGSSGFIGTHTVKKLINMGMKVYGYDIKTRKRGHDICDYDMLASVIDEGDSILHLAAVSRFADAEHDPREAWRTNVHGTATVALAAANKGAHRLVYSSTGSAYMSVDPKQVPITEDHPTNPGGGEYGGGNSVYGHTKAAAELPIRIGKTPWIILRYAHLYGMGKEWGAVGAFVDRMDRGLKPTLFGGDQSNDFGYINDVVDANLLALFATEPEALNQCYNIGTGEELTTEEAFKTMRRVFGYRKEFERTEQRGVDASRMVFDISKARKLLGYEPKFSLAEGLADMKKYMK